MYTIFRWMYRSFFSYILVRCGIFILCIYYTRFKRLFSYIWNNIVLKYSHPYSNKYTLLNNIKPNQIYIACIYTHTKEELLYKITNNHGMKWKILLLLFFFFSSIWIIFTFQSSLSTIIIERRFLTLQMRFLHDIDWDLRMRRKNEWNENEFDKTKIDLNQNMKK